MRPGEEVFHSWYMPNGIGSGHGSSPTYTESFQRFLEAFMNAQNVQTVVDYGCGDWQWAQFVKWGERDYHGFDIVPELVERLRLKHGAPNRKFDLISDPETFESPEADLIICKDVLQHLSNTEISSLIDRLSKKAPNILWINDRDTGTWNNCDIKRGGYRRLDLSKPPFSLRGVVAFSFGSNDYKIAFWHRTKESFRSVASPPRVALAILAKQKELTLPYYLECINRLDYPKKSIALYIRTNNNTDHTADILREWVAKVGSSYELCEFVDHDVDIPVERYDVHEWNTDRFRVLADIRQKSLEFAEKHKCDFYFTSDVDNFIVPSTLKDLIDVNLPIVAPLLHHAQQDQYSNFHAAVDANGYCAYSSHYDKLFHRDIQEIFEVPVVHCTYLIRADVIPYLKYSDGTSRHEYVIFSSSARAAAVPQYIDTRKLYGYLTLVEKDIESAKALMLSLLQRST